MCDHIRQANFTTKPCFESANRKFHCGQIPKAATMRKIPLVKQHEGDRGFRKFLANKAGGDVECDIIMHKT